VKVENLRISYNDLLVVDGVSFEVFKGEVISLLGPSGCGKTSIIKAILGLVNFEGVIERNGEGIGYMPQKDILFDWMDALDNASLPLILKGKKKERARDVARKMFREFGLEGFEDKKPYQLSGGMRQRLSFIRAILSGRDILLLDEPFGAVDAYTRRHLQLWLSKNLEKLGSTIIMVTHNIEEAIFLSDRIFILSDKPAKVVKEIVVPLKRPRCLDTFGNPTFSKLEKEVMEVIFS